MEEKTSREELILSYVTDFEKAKDRIIYKLINADLNKGRLKNSPYRLLEDLAIVYYLDIGLKMSDGTKQYIVINDSFLNYWDLKEKDLFELANINTPNVLPVLMMTSNEMSGKQIIPNWVPTYILTNKEKINGATSILYPGVLKDLAAKLDTDLGIIPSSICETIVGPKKYIICDQLNETIKTANMSLVGPGEILSWHPYIYKRDCDKIVSA